MKRTSLWTLVPIVSLVLATVFAQEPPPPPPQDGPPPQGGRGGLDPAQMQKRMLEHMQESLGANAEEWQIIEPRLSAVMDKTRALREMSGRGMFRPPQGRQQREGQREQPAEVAALEKALEGDDAAVIKTAMEALRQARKTKEADATKAKESLREVLSVVQEGKLVLMGLLD